MSGNYPPDTTFTDNRQTCIRGKYSLSGQIGRVGPKMYPSGPFTTRYLSPLLLFRRKPYLYFTGSFFARANPNRAGSRFNKSVKEQSFFYNKEVDWNLQIVFEDEKMGTFSIIHYKLLKANELQTRFHTLVISWLSDDNNSPSSLNYIRPWLNYIRPCCANKPTCSYHIGTYSRQNSEFII